MNYLVLIASLLLGVAGAIKFTNIFKVGKKNVNKSAGFFLITSLVLFTFPMWGGMVGFNTQSVVSTSTDVVEADGGVQYTIATLKVKTMDEKSGSFSAVAGDIKLYLSGVDPTNPTASPVASGTLSSGVLTLSGEVETDTPYRVIFDGNGYYGEDFGEIQFSSSKYDSNQGTYTWKTYETLGRGMYKIATIDDMLDETTNSTDLNGGDWNSNESSDASGEIKSSTADTIYYDESEGDGQFYITPTISFSGANTVVKDPVLCFEDGTNAPEGNEVSSIVAQLQTGQNLNIPSELVNYWAKEGCIALGDVVAGGTSGKYKFTISVTESNLDSNDEWKFVVDDLGEIDGKDVALESGATKDSITIGAVA